MSQKSALRTHLLYKNIGRTHSLIQKVIYLTLGFDNKTTAHSQKQG